MIKATLSGNVTMTQQEIDEINSTTIDRAKTAKLTQIKRERQNTIDSPLNGFDVDTVSSRENIEGAIDYFDTLTSNGTNPLMWTMADNTEIEVAKSDLIGTKEGYILRKAQAFAVYQAKKSQLNAATTVQEIEAV